MKKFEFRDKSVIFAQDSRRHKRRRRSLDSMAEHNDLGKWGEAEASRYLESKGYAILDRDWRFGKRDLDIVALSEDA